ncbi:MAG: hypothetical protein JXA30_02170 [Deltaproteobacteria bacterium]|nr:hypothetical protein [Deltaproteobacteria bacterium]
MTKTRRRSERCCGETPGRGADGRAGSCTRDAELFASEGEVDQSVVPGDASAGVASDSTLSLGFLQALSEAVEQAKIPREELLRAAGFGPEQLNAVEHRLPLSEVYRICELALDLTGRSRARPALG